MTDPFGRKTIFTYDATNQHLISVQETDGSTYAYTYDTETDPAKKNAMTPTVNPDGRQHSSHTISRGGLAASARMAAASPSRSPTV